MSSSIVVSVYDMCEGGSTEPILRLLCLSDKEAWTFSADLAGNDCFERGAPKKFSAAWGASNLSFLPDNVLDVGFSPQDKNGQVTLMRDGSVCSNPEQFEAAPSPALPIVPGLWVHKVGENSLEIAVQQGVDSGDPL